MFRILLSLVFVVVAGCSDRESIVRIEGPTMGTAYHIAWVGDPAKAEAIQADIDQRLAAINRIMSTYDPTSELSLINQSKAPLADDGWIPVSADLADVIADSLEIYQKSGGVFDISVGPLVNLWGFGPDAHPDEVPSEDVLAEAMSRTGLDVLQFDPQRPAIKLAQPRYLDLSAIAKGWGVDDIAALLEGKNIHNYMVEIGGEIRTGGRKPGDAPWRIAVERPGALADGRNVELVIEPEDVAVATSGDYRNYFERDGVRYSHTINPFTGRPITHRLASATVIDASSAMADGWATALNVAGPEKGMALAEQYRMAVFMIVRTDDGFSELSSAEFRRRYLQQP